MTRCSGRKSTCMIVELLRYGISAIPGMSGTRARPPTLMKICFASSNRSPTRIVFGPSKRACPWIIVSPDVPPSQFVRPSVEWRTMESLRFFTSAISTRIGASIVTPKSAPWRATCAALALAISVLVGMQPLLTQVPPMSLRSMIAVLRLALASRTASEGPACPAPMTMASKRSVMCECAVARQPSCVGAPSCLLRRRGAPDGGHPHQLAHQACDILLPAQEQIGGAVRVVLDAHREDSRRAQTENRFVGRVVADVERAIAMRLRQQRGERLALVRRARRQEIEHELAIEQRRHGKESAGAADQHSLRGAVVAGVTKVERERVGLVFEHDTRDLAPRLGCAGELIEPRAADAGAVRRGLLEAGHAFGTVIADEITWSEAEHRPRVLDRASGDDRYRSTLRECAQALLHLVRYPRVPRSVDDRS